MNLVLSLLFKIFCKNPGPLLDIKEKISNFEVCLLVLQWSRTMFCPFQLVKKYQPISSAGQSKKNTHICFLELDKWCFKISFSNGSLLSMSYFAFSQFSSQSNPWPNQLDLLVWTFRLRKKEATPPWKQQLTESPWPAWTALTAINLFSRRSSK